MPWFLHTEVWFRTENAYVHPKLTKLGKMTWQIMCQAYHFVGWELLVNGGQRCCRRRAQILVCGEILEGVAKPCKRAVAEWLGSH